MRKVASLALLCAASCGTGDNVVVGGIGSSDITPVIEFNDIRSVISGRAHLFDASGTPNGSAQVVIISDQPQLCDQLKAHPDYFRNATAPYQALILYLPDTDHLGTFIPGRPGDEGTSSQIIGVKDTGTPVPPFTTTKPVAPFPVLQDFGYISLREWSIAPDGEADGTFYLAYNIPEALRDTVTITQGFQFSGKYKATSCPTLDGTLLPACGVTSCPLP